MSNVQTYCNFKLDFQTSGPTYKRHQTPQGQSVAKPETVEYLSRECKLDIKESQGNIKGTINQQWSCTSSNTKPYTGHMLNTAWHTKASKGLCPYIVFSELRYGLMMKIFNEVYIWKGIDSTHLIHIKWYYGECHSFIFISMWCVTIYWCKFLNITVFILNGG